MPGLFGRRSFGRGPDCAGRSIRKTYTPIAGSVSICDMVNAMVQYRGEIEDDVHVTNLQSGDLLLVVISIQ